MLYKRENSKFYYVKLKHMGREVRKSTRATNKRDAQRFEERLRKHLCAIRSASGYTFGQAAERWMTEKSHKRSFATDLIVLEWFAPHLEHTLLSEITRDRVEELRALKLEEAGRETVNRYFQVLRAILKIARDDWEWIGKIPKVPMHPKKKREPRFLTEAQFLTFVAELPPHLAAPAWFSVSTGLRTKPIQRLQWDWIDRRSVTFPANVIKNGERFTIPLSATAWHVLAEQHGASERFVFVTPAGKHWAGKFTTKAWKKAAARAGVPDATFHDLRHTWASWMLQKGVPRHVVKELGGWKDDKAMDIYARFDTGSLERLAGYV